MGTGTGDLAAISIESGSFAAALVVGHLRDLYTASMLAGIGEANVAGSALLVN